MGISTVTDKSISRNVAAKHSTDFPDVCLIIIIPGISTYFGVLLDPFYKNPNKNSYKRDTQWYRSQVGQSLVAISVTVRYMDESAPTKG